MNQISKYTGRLRVFLLTAFVFAGAISVSEARVVNPKLERIGRRLGTNRATANPIIEYGVHKRGNILLAVGNNGTFGTEGATIFDPLTGDPTQSCIYPRGSSIFSLWVASVWIGAVVGRDTLVSVGNEDFYQTLELWPDVKPFGDVQYYSIDPHSQFASDQAYSEEDIYCEYTDTIVDPGLSGRDPTDARGHKPLGVKVTQRSMAWSYPYADDFILFDYRVQNIGPKQLKDVYLGIWVDGDIWHDTRPGIGWLDDMVGFYRTHPAPEGCGLVDTIDVAWWADNDGDPEGGAWNEKSARSILGVRVVRTPADSLEYNFNWWIINYGDASRDFGPRTIGDRDFGARLGTPEGDLNKYHILSHREFDYDLMHTALDHSMDGWLPPPSGAEDYARGWDTRYLLSFGPFDISPGQKLPISFAFVAGEDFHVDPTAYENLFDPYAPHKFTSTLDFSSIAASSRWASWIYDNPGVDTNGDGYFGKIRVCNLDSGIVIDTIYFPDSTVFDSSWSYTVADTTFYQGDGVPDFRGAAPPPPPKAWLEPSFGSVKVRFNGQLSETTIDNFSKTADFEGYRVHLGREDHPESYAVVASYDLYDFNKWIWNPDNLPFPDYVLLNEPFTLEQLRCLYGRSCDDGDFDPLRFSRSTPFVHPDFPHDSLFFFEAQDFNVSMLGVNTDIEKRFPDQPYPSDLNVAFARPDELTDDGYLKYFEYEIILENLLPSIPYWVNITTFDFGSPEVGLAALESSVAVGGQIAYPLDPIEAVEAEDLDVYVYPNPYRVDAGYGYDNLEHLIIGGDPDRSRLLHFANLPRVCTIRIYTLDGDLVSKFNHDFPEGGAESMHDTWDLITRNTQAVVSGLYYFVVESEDRVQIGKFAIIK